jgi:hypothetical protein
MKDNSLQKFFDIMLSMPGRIYKVEGLGHWFLIDFTIGSEYKDPELFKVLSGTDKDLYECFNDCNS